jgi:lipoyl(octanoyl) transferase
MASCGVQRPPTEAGDALARNLERAWARARNKT